QQWAAKYPENAFENFTKNIAIDLKDGYLDANTIRGDKSVLNSLITPSPENIDPNKNNAKDIAENQKNNRVQFGNSLKEAVLLLARNARQDTTNPNGYKLLTQYTYTGTEPTHSSTINVRTIGAGDYRRA